MDVKTIANEPKRGCGYRQPGGLYLVSGRPSAPCGKLPLALEVCPCCSQGIKPARGWTWVNGKLLFEGIECPLKAQVMPANYNCVLDQPPERMGLLWIGEKFYSTPADFLKEGMALGVSRRISAIPNDFVIGETWVLFAHRKTISRIDTCQFCGGVGWIVERVAGQDELDEKQCAQCKGAGKLETWKPGIFGCFLPERIEYAVKDDDDEEKLRRMEDRGITLIRLVRIDDGNGVLHFDGDEVA